MYSPKISEDLTPVIKRRSLKLKKPMTKVVDKILRSALTIESQSNSKSAVELKNNL